MTTNHQRVTEGFQTLTEVLAPYVARELRAKYKNEWWDQGMLRVLHDNQKRDLPAGGEDGWFLVARRGSHRQYKHPIKPGRVTVAGKPSDEVAPGTLGSIRKQAQLTKEGR